jgi:hypothetical protein
LNFDQGRNAFRECGRLWISVSDFLFFLLLARRTLERWRSWWRTQFVKTSFWQAEQGRFMPPLPIDALPESLLARFGGDDMRWRVVLLLRFLLPLTGPGTFTYLDGR